MDPSMFLQYSPPTGLPQESKLVTYMSRSPAATVQPLSQAMGKLSLDSSPTENKKLVLPEFIPQSYYNPSQLVLPDSPDPSPPTNMAPLPSNHQIHQANVGGTTYFYPTSSDSLGASGVLNASQNIGVASGVVPSSQYQSRYDQHLQYMSTRTDLTSNTSTAGLQATFYPDNQTIINEISQRNDHIYMQPDTLQYPDLPDQVDNYTDLVPLEAPGGLTSTYRVTNGFSGKQQLMRRLHSYSTANATRNLDQWKSLVHPNVVRLYDLFTTKSFNDHSMVFVYEYHAGSETLLSKYLSYPGEATADSAGAFDPFSSDPMAPRPYTHRKNAILRAAACGTLLPESVLWNVLIQLTAALRAIHGAGLACRNLDASKVLMTGCRVRITFCGTADALTPHISTHSTAADIAKAQQDDLMALGQLALSLACRSVHAHLPDNTLASIKKLNKMYSYDLKNFIMYLMSQTVRNRSVNNLMPMIGARFYTQLETLQTRVDVIEENLAREMDNERILKILLKLGTINERPEFSMDESWSETGDRYMLKLFRDYLFHSVTPEGRPWLDLAHIVHCLNQLDAGTEDQVQLVSRDEQSILVVKYSELKSYLDKAFDELTQAAELLPLL